MMMMMSEYLPFERIMPQYTYLLLAPNLSGNLTWLDGGDERRCRKVPAAGSYVFYGCH